MGRDSFDTWEHKALQMIPGKLARVCVHVCVLGKERLGMRQSAAWTLPAEYTREGL